MGIWILKGGVEGSGRSGLYVFTYSLLPNFQQDFLNGIPAPPCFYLNGLLYTLIS